MPRGLDLMRVVVGWSLVLTTLAMLVVAYWARTVRQYGEIGQWGATVATDGIRWWQGWLLLCVLLTWLVLVIVLSASQPRWWLLLVPVVGFVLVARNAEGFRQWLLAEQVGPRTYEAEVPLRLPPLTPFEVRETPVQYEYETVTRVYNLSIPWGIEAAIVGCWVAIALLALLIVLGVAEDWIHRAQRNVGRIATTTPRA